MTTLALYGSCSWPLSHRFVCEACGRPIRCVYVVDDGGWVFYLGRRCFERLSDVLAAEPV